MSMSKNRAVVPSGSSRIVPSPWNNPRVGSKLVPSAQEEVVTVRRDASSKVNEKRATSLGSSNVPSQAESAENGSSANTLQFSVVSGTTPPQDPAGLRRRIGAADAAAGASAIANNPRTKARPDTRI